MRLNPLAKVEGVLDVRVLFRFGRRWGRERRIVKSGERSRNRDWIGLMSVRGPTRLGGGGYSGARRHRGWGDDRTTWKPKGSRCLESKTTALVCYCGSLLGASPTLGRGVKSGKKSLARHAFKGRGGDPGGRGRGRGSTQKTRSDGRLGKLGE